MIRRLSTTYGRTVGLIGGVALALVASIPVVGSGAELALEVAVPHPEAENGYAINRLLLGTHSLATDQFDLGYDLEAVSTLGLTAAVVHPEAVFPLQPLWWHDWRGTAASQVWDLDVRTDQQDVDVRLRWTPPSSAPGECTISAWTLHDPVANRVVSLSDASQYSYRNVGPAGRRLQITLDEITSIPPGAPYNLWSPRQGRSGVYLAWSGSGGSGLKYHVYRTVAGVRVRLTASALTTTSFLDSSVNRSLSVLYHVTAVGGATCESDPSPGLTLVAQP